MIGYVIALIVLAVFALYLFVDGLWTHTELDIVKTDIDELYKGFNDYRARCEAHKELIEALSKSVRELNGVVEAAVKVKEQTSDNKPDISALMGGWTTDDDWTKIDASHISTGMIDGKSVMNCELPNISDSDYEKICELFEAKVPEDEPKLTAHSVDKVLGFTASGDVVWVDKKGHVHHGAYGD